MYLVKSCNKKHHPNTSGTIRIGSLTEYRDLENKQVEDREEGFYRINFDLKDKWISIDLFNHLNNSHLSHFRGYVKSLSMKGGDGASVLVDYQANYEWVNLNRFIFCIT
ncbi:TPA: hypothetical protein ACR6TF_001886, partial [Klebsiella pneumoniae]